MSLWVDVRVAAEDGRATLQALLDELAPLTFRYDDQPFASGPEVEVSVERYTEPEVRRVLGRRGIEILASRTRLGGRLEVPEEARS